MDEIVFRSSQRLENLQIQFGIAAEQGKIMLEHLKDQSKTVLGQIGHSPILTNTQDVIKEVLTHILQALRKSKEELIVNLNNIYKNTFQIVILKCTRQNLYFGCAGFLLGGLIGFGIGIAMYKQQSYVRYMQAIQCIDYQGPNAVAVVEDAMAPNECGLNEVLIDVKAASVNLIDIQISNGYGHQIRRFFSKYRNFSKVELPVTLGRDCSGVIIDIGRNVNRLEVGDEVWVAVPFWAPGTLSQIVLAQENKVSKKPKTVGYEAATSLPYAGSIALSALQNCSLTANNCTDKRVFIEGGCTPVGCVLIQLLNNWRAHITTTCFKRAEMVAKALGAHDIICLPEEINCQSNNFTSLKKELELREKFDVIIITRSLDLKLKEFHSYCSTNGKVFSTLPPVLSSDSLGYFLSFFFWFYLEIKCFVQSMYQEEFDFCDESHMCFLSLDKLTDLVETNQLQTVVDKIYHPSDVDTALVHIRSSESIGSTIISFRS